MTPALTVTNMSKSFAGPRVLDSVTLSIEPGEIRALVGENGSGKSTLIKILAGFHVPDEGSAEVAGEPLHLGAGTSSEALGLRFVHQDLGLVDTLDAVDNMALGAGYPSFRGGIRWRQERKRARGLLTELGYDRVDVLGISWGGGVAQHFAAFQRARCRRLVLVSTATGSLMVPARPAVLARMVTPRRYLDRGYMEQVAGSIYGGSAREDPGRIAAAMNNGNRVGPSRGYLYQLTAGAGWTSVPFLPLLRQRTLIVSGDDDPIIPLANARLMKLLIPKARLHVFHGGHLGLVSEATELAPIVDAFLTAPD
jgi:pimeloyl-ACP methyl ester carboxylesterase